MALRYGEIVMTTRCSSVRRAVRFATSSRGPWLDQLRLVARPEGVGERDDVRVVALVDLPGGRGLDTQAVRSSSTPGAPRTCWTVATVDDALAAHSERTIAITANGPRDPDPGLSGSNVPDA